MRSCKSGKQGKWIATKANLQRRANLPACKDFRFASTLPLQLCRSTLPVRWAKECFSKSLLGMVQGRKEREDQWKRLDCKERIEVDSRAPERARVSRTSSSSSSESRFWELCLSKLSARRKERCEARRPCGRNSMLGRKGSTGKRNPLGILDELTERRSGKDRTNN